tara:strand:- start:85 stop:264 length:180 start_codon:yes stop_codon:yes gene_type:complete
MRPEHAKIVKKYPFLMRVIIVLMIIAIIAAFVELVFDPNPITKNESTIDYFSFDHYDIM